jgi:hypothetical protein
MQRPYAQGLGVLGVSIYILLIDERLPILPVMRGQRPIYTRGLWHAAWGLHLHTID